MRQNIYSRCMAAALILSTALKKKRGRRRRERRRKKPAKTYNNITKFVHKSRILCKSRKSFYLRGSRGWEGGCSGQRPPAEDWEHLQHYLVHCAVVCFLFFVVGLVWFLDVLFCFLLRQGFSSNPSCYCYSPGTHSRPGWSQTHRSACLVPPECWD